MSLARDLFQRSQMKKQNQNNLRKILWHPWQRHNLILYPGEIPVGEQHSAFPDFPLLPPDLPGRTSSFPCSTTKLIIPERAVKLNHSCTCNAANVLESFKIKATLLINLYFYIPCSWKIQLKHYSDLLAENDCHSEDRIRRHPKQSSGKNGICRERDSCSCFTSVTGVVKDGLIQ